MTSGIERPFCNLFGSAVLSGASCGKNIVVFLTTDHTDDTDLKDKVTASLEAGAFDGG